ncbi:NfeD family protein [Enterococcus saccharolyticus]|uniref:Hydrolase n=1 Tax=Candidatus Enterococcus willemsii TaxID=1857215 RepID=A0ABQ6Z0D7_9ENTE|nr:MULTISPECIES: hydrolase [Enterococcus]KAF1304413.1 hydrolase [Enterococcus sp. CU12B]MCD5002217.1 NfeD family protein [Enterococcus saccharolyticus]
MEGLLLALGFVGLACALLTSWTKTGTLVTLVSFYFYFDLLGLEQWLPFILFSAGLLLVLFEVLIPGFGFVGVLGGILLALGLYYTTGDIFQTVRDLSMAIISVAAVIVFLVRNGYTLAGVSQFVLKTDLPPDNEVLAEDNQVVLYPGLIGEAQTPLRPSGKATFGDASPLYDVLSAEGLIDIHTSIIIEKIQGTKILVRKFTEGDD